MRNRKRWIAIMLMLVMAIGDCGGTFAFAAEQNAGVAESSVSGNGSADEQTGEDDRAGEEEQAGKEGQADEDDRTGEEGQADEEEQAGEEGQTGEDDRTADGETISDQETTSGESVSENEITKGQDDGIRLPALHIGQIEMGEEFPETEDSEFKYDLPVSLEVSERLTLFTDYSINGVLDEEEGAIVWTILRGEKGAAAGSTNLVNEEDDWTDFETVSESPCFMLTEKEENSYCEITGRALEEALRQGDYDYYIRAAYYLEKEKKQDEKFYAAATVPFLPKENLDTPDAEEDFADEEQSDMSIPEDADEENALDGTLAQDGAEEMTEDTGDAEREMETADAGRFETGSEGEEVSSVSANDVRPAAEEAITELILSETNITMHPGETKQIGVKTVPENVPVSISWGSGDKAVATVDETGLITAKAEGIVRITAAYGDITAAAVVTVEPADTDKVLDLSRDIWVAGFKKESKDFVYTGQKITQDIRIYHKETLLKEKTDYTVSYKNNINAAAWNAAKAPSVTVTLKGQYQGSVTLHYTILPADINNSGMSGTGNDSLNEGSRSPGYEQAVNYAKNVKIPNPDLTFNNKKLKINKDFICDYSALPADYKKGDSYEVGKVYHYTVNGTGNFKGSFQMQLVILDDKGRNFSSAVATFGQKQYEYHGTPLSKAEVTVEKLTVNRQELEKNLYDYEVYAKELKGAYVMIYPSEEGRNKGYFGCKKVNLKLAGDRKIQDASLGERWKESIVFSQNELKENGGFYQEKTGVLTYGTEAGAELLTEGVDYTVKYGNVRKAGMVTVTFTGIGRYTGSRREKYEIKPNKDNKNFTIIWRNAEYKDGELHIPYEKGGASPDFVLKDQDRNILKDKVDYTVKLTDNNEPGKTMTCLITGKGNYKGYTESVQLKVTSGDIGQAVISVPDKPCSEKQDAWKAKVTIKDRNGKALAAGKDYDKDVDYEYNGMESGQLPQEGSTVKVTVHGTGFYAGSKITGSYRIYKNSIGKLHVAIDDQEYTGEEVELTQKDIHVYATAADKKDKKNELPASCYKIGEHKNNIKAGTAKVTLRGMGDYGGTKTYSFKIQKKVYQINRVKSISLDKTSLVISLAEKERKTLMARIEPQNVWNPNIIWSSSNSQIAAVEESTTDGGTTVGIISAKAPGDVTITATTQDGGKKAQCKVKIVDAPILKEAGQTIKGEVGQTYQLAFEKEDGQEINTAGIEWTSSNSEIVSVDSKGLLTMKKAGTVIIKVYACNRSYVQQCYVTVQGDEVLPEGKCLTYNQPEGCTNDTPGINRLLRQWEYNPNAYDYMYIPAGVYWIDGVSDFGGIVLTDNQTLIMSPGALLMAIPNGSDNYQVILAFGRKNIKISGGQIVGERSEHTGRVGEWGHGIRIQGCTNVTIENVDISQCWGDGIDLEHYDGWDDDGNRKKITSSNITITNCNLHHNRRNNLSITAADYVTIDKCKFNYAKGTDPQFGIDIETNDAKDPCEHITISNSEFIGNAKGSMGIITPANDIRLENCTLDGAFYNMAGKNVVLHNTTIKGEVVDPNGGIRRE